MDDPVKSSVHAKAVAISFFSSACQEVLNKDQPSEADQRNLVQKVIAIGELGNQIKAELEKTQ